MALHPCTHCGRHVRHHEKTCPFCLNALSDMSGEQAPVLRVSRAAMWLGAALVAGGCEQPAPTTTSSAPSTTATPAAPNTPQVLPTSVTNAQGVAPQQGLFPQAQIAPTQESPAQQMLAQPQPAANPTPSAVRPQDIGSVAARYGRAPVVPPPQGPDDPGSHARRYGAPALIAWDEV
jgi:hypothetical protein